MISIEGIENEELGMVFIMTTSGQPFLVKFDETVDEAFMAINNGTNRLLYLPEAAFVREWNLNERLIAIDDLDFTSITINADRIEWFIYI